MEIDKDLMEIMNSTAVKSHIGKEGIVGMPSQGVLDMNGIPIPKKKMSKELEKLMKANAEYKKSVIENWVYEEVKDIIPIEFHELLSDFKEQVKLMNKFGIEVGVEFIARPDKEGFCEQYTRLGADIVTILIKNKPYNAQVFIWDENA